MDIWKCKKADLLYKVEHNSVWCSIPETNKWNLSGFSAEAFLEAVKKGHLFEQLIEDTLTLENE